MTLVPRQSPLHLLISADPSLNQFCQLFQMVQGQVQFDDARQAAELSYRQNRALFAFTGFTVIFLPLSFFTSLFGMNTREWGGGDNLPLSTISRIALPLSFALVIPTMFVAIAPVDENIRKIATEILRVVNDLKGGRRDV